MKKLIGAFAIVALFPCIGFLHEQFTKPPMKRELIDPAKIAAQEAAKKDSYTHGYNCGRDFVSQYSPMTSKTFKRLVIQCSSKEDDFDSFYRGLVKGFLQAGGVVYND